MMVGRWFTTIIFDVVGWCFFRSIPSNIGTWMRFKHHFSASTIRTESVLGRWLVDFMGISWDFMGFHIWETMVSWRCCFPGCVDRPWTGNDEARAAGFSGRRRFLPRTMALRPSCAMQANIGQQSLQSEAMRNTKIATFLDFSIFFPVSCFKHWDLRNVVRFDAAKLGGWHLGPGHHHVRPVGWAISVQGSQSSTWFLAIYPLVI